MFFYREEVEKVFKYLIKKKFFLSLFTTFQSYFMGYNIKVMNKLKLPKAYINQILKIMSLKPFEMNKRAVIEKQLHHCSTAFLKFIPLSKKIKLK